MQDQSVTNTTTEASFSISYTDKVVNYTDGTSVTLRNPEYIISDLAYGDLASNLQVSPRVAQQMVGLGFIRSPYRKNIIKFC